MRALTGRRSTRAGAQLAERLLKRAMAYVHHLALHFPIALGILAPLLIVLGWKRAADDGWRRAALFVACFAAAGAIVAAASGLLAASHVIESGGDASRIGLHRNVALAATALLILAAASAWRAQLRGSFRWFAAAASGIAALTGGVAAHLGGDMLHPGLAPWSAETHHHGAGAATPPASADRASAAGVAAPAPPGDMADMAHATPAPDAPAAPVASLSAPPLSVPSSSSAPRPAAPQPRGAPAVAPTPTPVTPAPPATTTSPPPATATPGQHSGHEH